MKKLMIVPDKGNANTSSAASQAHCRGQDSFNELYNAMVARVGTPLIGLEVSIDTGGEDTTSRLWGRVLGFEGGVLQVEVTEK